MGPHFTPFLLKALLMDLSMFVRILNHGPVKYYIFTRSQLGTLFFLRYMCVVGTGSVQKMVSTMFSSNSILIN